MEWLLGRIPNTKLSNIATGTAISEMAVILQDGIKNIAKVMAVSHINRFSELRSLDNLVVLLGWVTAYTAPHIRMATMVATIVIAIYGIEKICSVCGVNMVSRSFCPKLQNCSPVYHDTYEMAKNGSRYPMIINATCLNDRASRKMDRGNTAARTIEGG